MIPAELDAIRDTIAAISERAAKAEVRAAIAEAERDNLRRLLSRIHTSLAEATTLRGEA